MLFFFFAAFTHVACCGASVLLCVTALWLWRWHFIFPLPPETWALSLTMTTLEPYPPLHPARCTNNPLCTQGFFFLIKASCETNLLSICPVWEGLEIKFPFWGILRPAELEIKLHSVLFFFRKEMQKRGFSKGTHTHTQAVLTKWHLAGHHPQGFYM